MAHEHSFGSGLYDKNPNQVLELIRLWKTTKTTLPYKEIHSFFSYFCNVTHENEKKKKRIYTYTLYLP